MKKASLVISKYLQKNEIFNEDSELNRDFIFDKYINLRKEFSKFGVDLSTNDINTIEESAIIIYFDMPSVLPKPEKIDCSFLVLVESELIRPDNYALENHRYFNKVFTWHDELVDDVKYFKLNFSHRFPQAINQELTKKQKLCTLIAGNKRSPKDNQNELYSSRVDAIRWFENFYPENFDLYGVGWDTHRFHGPKLIRALNRVPYVGKVYLRLTGQVYPSYRGTVSNKKQTMERYKFSICYENAKNIPGYITEKIFDSFFAGCVPVYWGANNIADYVPPNCFIDKRKFATYEQLYNFLSTMSDELYLTYIDNIQRYLNSTKSHQFTGKGFGEKLAACILGKDS